MPFPLSRSPSLPWPSGSRFVADGVVVDGEVEGVALTGAGATVVGGDLQCGWSRRRGAAGAGVQRGADGGGPCEQRDGCSSQRGCRGPSAASAWAGARLLGRQPGGAAVPDGSAQESRRDPKGLRRCPVWSKRVPAPVRPTGWPPARRWAGARGPWPAGTARSRTAPGVSRAAGGSAGVGRRRRVARTWRHPRRDSVTVGVTRGWRLSLPSGQAVPPR